MRETVYVNVYPHNQLGQPWSSRINATIYARVDEPVLYRLRVTSKNGGCPYVA